MGVAIFKSLEGQIAGFVALRLIARPGDVHSNRAIGISVFVILSIGWK